jgi:FixJ family two-component response regulator
MTEISPRRGPARSHRLLHVAPAAGSDAELPEAGPRQIVPSSDPVGVVDDDIPVCHSLTVLLETFGFETLSYSSVIEFLADERRRRLGCLIIDQHMPGMTGLDVIAALKREGVQVPAILITGRLDARIAERAERLGVAGILGKPFPVSRLIGLIRDALRSRG